ncbi:MAG TPA: hypothetical protein VMF30_19015 [Pirellulales bacterium]|nr:hypothetical protein [Pirellulales bacterium]
MPAANGTLLLATLLDAQTVRWVVWSGLVALTLALLVLMRTRWGQSHPLRKCIVLSLVAHLLLGIYTTTVNIVTGGRGPNNSAPLRVAFIAADVEGLTNADVPSDATGEPEHAWDALGNSSAAELNEKITPPKPLAGNDAPPAAPPTRPTPESKLPDDIGRPAFPNPSTPASQRHTPATPPAAIEAPRPERSATSAPVPERPATTAVPPPPDPAGDIPPPPAPIAQPDVLSGLVPVPAPAKETNKARTRTPGPSAAAEAAVPSPSGSPNNPPANPTAGNPAGDAAASPHPLPELYELRMEPDRLRAAIGHGGTRETEEAVKAALTWLATHQTEDGRWRGRQLEAGRGGVIDGQDRRDSGTQADTGLTGLAMLAFLASGHTHREGEHKEQMRRGVEYLVSVQADDGNLGGQGTLYEKMYCHAMATFALSECCAMSQDDRLRTPVKRAIDYTLRAQNPGGGSWRYQPRDAGDMSQLGWQYMALKSAEMAGIPIPTDTRLGMLRFIGSVTSGRHNGLASYRPGHKVSRTMTAEALVCRQFMGMSRSNPACDEAGDFLIAELPGQGTPNFYYWYYGTLAMYQLQGEHWKQWNEALQNTLVGTQRSEGALAGSWDPDPVWGTCGGRAYSTALGTLCLEVYYRYLPLHIEAASRGGQRK